MLLTPRELRFSADVEVTRITTQPLGGKVALITGAARGQGRSHAIRLAALGADIIGVDICRDIATVRYPLAKPADLAETVALVEALGRRMVARQVDIRDLDLLQAAVNEGVGALGGLDIVVANAGIAAFGPGGVEHFRDTIDVNLVGTWHTLEASVPHLRAGHHGGSIVIISSSAGTSGKTSEVTPGTRGYVASKHAVIGLMRSYALDLGREGIRVNAITPCGVDTLMINHESNQGGLLAKSELMDWDLANVIPVPYLAANDISDAVVWLASDASKYVTGVVLPVDAGYALK